MSTLENPTLIDSPVLNGDISFASNALARSTIKHLEERVATMLELRKTLRADHGPRQPLVCRTLGLHDRPVRL